VLRGVCARRLHLGARRVVTSRARSSSITGRC
jgi:hypothetical protein